MSIMNKLTASYLAGLIDGDGSIEIQKRKKPTYKDGAMYVARIRITLTNKDLIHWLKGSFGGWISKRKGKGNKKDSYEWCLNYGNRKFIEKVFPYLKIKKKQAEIVKRFYKTIPDSGKWKLADNKEREKLFQEMKNANKRGRDLAR